MAYGYLAAVMESNLILDNPAWGALTTANSNLAHGSANVKFFDAEVSPYAAFRDIEENALASNFAELHSLTATGRVVLYLSLQELPVPANWKCLNTLPGVQMVYNNHIAPAAHTINVVKLTAEHLPQMVALTKLTNPGPFAQRTIEFGHYCGVFDDDKLVAMAGQRLHAGNFTEVSAVCTHPDYLGRGYARAILIHQVNRMLASGNIPYLHVREDNSRAINVYEAIGFKIRRKVIFYVLQNEPC